MTTTTQNKMQLTWCRTWGGAVYAVRTVPVAKGAELENAVVKFVEDEVGVRDLYATQVKDWEYWVYSPDKFMGYVTVRVVG